MFMWAFNVKLICPNSLSSKLWFTCLLFNN